MDGTTQLKPPLDGIRVIDLTRVLSGPFCTMMLGDMGAEVIKIEPRKGDPIREQGTIRDGLSWYYASFNRNKKSVVLDLYGVVDVGKLVLGILHIKRRANNLRDLSGSGHGFLVSSGQ